MFVSNTSTLVLLAKVGCLEAFVGISPIIEIPDEVKSEAMFETESFYARLIQKLIKEEKIRIVNADKKQINEIMLDFRLDEGEAAAYSLFDYKRHKAVLTDDGELIKLCKLQKVPFINSMAIVIRLFEKKKLSKEEAIGKLENLYKIGRYSKELYEQFRSEVK